MFYVYQVPLPFAVEVKSTYEISVSKNQRKYYHQWAETPGIIFRKKSMYLTVFAFHPMLLQK